MVRRSIRFLFILSIALIQYRCANESAPLGGKEDTEPPQVKKMMPENYSTSFAATEIEITFNEFIQDNGLPLTLISPAMDQAPVYRVNGRTLSIKLKGPLQPNTTYTINFGSDVKDLNQGNPIRNFKYVFSTGTYIDSAVVAGKVDNLLNEKELENIIISLYKTDTALPILSAKPDYFSRTDKSGNYIIENIKSGAYQIYALKDENLNFVFDQPAELIGFRDTAVLANDTVPRVVPISIFKEAAKNLRLLSTRCIQPGKIMITFNAPFKTLKLDSKLFREGYSSYVYPTKDTAIIWFSDYYTKSDSLYILANDTLFNAARLELKTIEKDSLFSLSKYAFLPVNQSISNKDKLGAALAQSPYESVKMKMNRPVLRINDLKVVEISSDSAFQTVRIKPTLQKEDPEVVALSFKGYPGKSYTAKIPDSLFTDIFGLHNKAFEYKFSTRAETDFGNIVLKATVENAMKHYIVELINFDNQVLHQLLLYGEKSTSLNVEHIPSGTYRIVVIEDDNANAEWDTGNLSQRKQPEKKIAMPGTHTLKGGWDLEIEIKL